MTCLMVQSPILHLESEEFLDVNIQHFRFHWSVVPVEKMDPFENILPPRICPIYRIDLDRCLRASI